MINWGREHAKLQFFKLWGYRSPSPCFKLPSLSQFLSYLGVLEYASKNNLKVDEFVEIAISSQKNTKQRRVDELLEKLNGSTDTLIVSEISRLGRSTTEVITLINALLDRGVRVIVIKQGLDLSKHDLQSKVMITLFSLFGELERDLISLRTKEALAAKRANGVKLGKPKGTIQRSKFDGALPKIKELLGYGLSVRKIAHVLGYSNHIALNTYIKKRGLKIVN